jgi:hypothetical protein
LGRYKEGYGRNSRDDEREDIKEQKYANDDLATGLGAVGGRCSHGIAK